MIFPITWNHLPDYLHMMLLCFPVCNPSLSAGMINGDPKKSQNEHINGKDV